MKNDCNWNAWESKNRASPDRRIEIHTASGNAFEDKRMTFMRLDDPLAERIRACVIDLLADRGAGRSICPSEVARALAASFDGQWQDLMRPVRAVAIELAESGVIEATQHESVVDLREVRGPVRLRLRAERNRSLA